MGVPGWVSICFCSWSFCFLLNDRETSPRRGADRLPPKPSSGFPDSFERGGTERLSPSACSLSDAYKTGAGWGRLGAELGSGNCGVRHEGQEPVPGGIHSSAGWSLLGSWREEPDLEPRPDMPGGLQVLFLPLSPQAGSLSQRTALCHPVCHTNFPPSRVHVPTSRDATDPT